MTIVKLFKDGTPVLKEHEPFVRLVTIQKNIMQGGQSTEQRIYELVPDLEIMQTMINFTKGEL